MVSPSQELMAELVSQVQEAAPRALEAQQQVQQPVLPERVPTQQAQRERQASPQSPQVEQQVSALQASPERAPPLEELVRLLQVYAVRQQREELAEEPPQQA